MLFDVPRAGLAALVAMSCAAWPAAAQITGTQYDTVTVDFTGDAGYAETDGRADPNAAAATVNPFLDRELEVTFTHTASGATYVVPGFFDGDGVGNGTGSVFRARFTPDRSGDWTYQATFKAGKNVAIGDTAGINVTGGSFTDGLAAPGTLNVSAAPVNAAGFHSKGRLLYNTGGDTLSKHYMRFQNGDYFIKGGADSPENFLGYKGFDNTQTKGSGGAIGVLHEFVPHADDFNGDGPTWNTPDFNFAGDTNGVGNDAANIAGAINYLASKNVNSIYFLPMNIGGDAKDTHPFANVSTTSQLNGNSSNDNAHYDISKLNQWEQFFGHAQDKGLLLHFVLNEAESPNKRELDNATLGPERKLFYREMIARFGHHNAVQWNVSEEYNLNLNLGATTVNEFADFIRSIDPYGNPITVHNARDPRDTWAPFIGDDSFDLTSLQKAGDRNSWSDIVEEFRFRTRDQGRAIPVVVDEPESPARISLGPNDSNRNEATRRYMMWDIYLSGGSVEWFIHNRDQSQEDFAEVHSNLDMARLWDETFYARNFLEANTPFWEMDSVILMPNTTPTIDDDYISADTLVRGADTDYGGAEVFFKDGEVYAIYLPDASNDDNNIAGNNDAPPELDLTDHAGKQFVIRWYNPRTGEFAENESMYDSVITSFLVEGGDWVSFGHSPDTQLDGSAFITEDWALLVEFVIPEPGSMMLFSSTALLLLARRRKP